jgi:SSS family solute:Na+ symporter
MINVVIIAVFLFGMIIVGLVSFKRIKSLNSFYVGDRSGGTISITGSLLATIIGGSSTLGIAGLGYAKGLVGAWWMLVGSIGLGVVAFWLARRIREYGVYTLPEILERQYGSNVIRIIASLLISISWVGIIAGQIIAAGKILSLLWPENLNAVMIVVGSIFVLYTVLGGQYSIIRTDVLQFVILIIGILICGLLGYAHTGGYQSIAERIPETFFSFPVSPAFNWYDLLIFLFFVGTTFLVGPDIYSRLFCSRNPEIARRSSLLTAIIMIPLAFIIASIGIFARALLPGIPPESAFPALVMHTIPTGFNGLVIASLLAAIMSSADTCLLTTGTIITADVINPISRFRISEKALLIISRFAVIVVGLFSIVIALKIKGIIAALLLAYTVYSAGLVVPVVFGFYSKRLRLNAVGAISAILGGGLLGLYLKLSDRSDLLLVCFPLSIVLLLSVSFIGYLRSRRGNRDPMV